MIWRKLAIYLLSAILSFGGGWYTGYKIHKVQQLGEANELLKSQYATLLEDFTEASGLSEGLTVRLDELQALSSTYQRKLRDAIANSDPVVVPACAAAQPAGEPTVAFADASASEPARPTSPPGLPVRTFLRSDVACLLNEARRGEGDPGAACGGDAEGETPAPTVSTARLIEADLEVVQQYHELAARHNTLVDALRTQTTCQIIHP